jgi:4-amino-4-deoxy-L-arabinose transferase-like glycosyltransferase
MTQTTTTSDIDVVDPINKAFWSRPELIVLLLPALAKLIMHLLAAPGYGLNGDELYYLACSNHLDWGYVDQPPLSIFLLHVDRLVLGDSVLSIRLLPALAGFFTVLLTGLLARQMGAKIFGRLIAQLCVLVAPLFLALNHMFSMNAFDVLFWIAAIYIVVLILDGRNPKLWMWFGLVAGLGLQNKISVLFLGFGLVVGLLFTNQRRQLLSPWIWLGGLMAVLLVLPNVVWQIGHGWPTLEWMGNARTQKMVALALPAFLVEQVILMQPLTVFVWATGLISLLFFRFAIRYRSLGWCYLAVLAVFVVLGGKAYYLGPIYPLLFAAGAVAIERWISSKWVRGAIIVSLLGGGAVTAPLGLPLLPVDDFIKYSEVLGVHVSSGERHAEGKLPSFYANMFGWQKMTAMVDTVYRSLSVEDQARCGVLCQNYMQAGAIDFYGKQYHLPHAIAGHNNYWLWGMQGYTGEVLIILGGNPNDLRKYFEEVAERARFSDEYIQPIHSDLPIYVVRKPRVSLAPLWPGVKSYI